APGSPKIDQIKFTFECIVRISLLRIFERNEREGRNTLSDYYLQVGRESLSLLCPDTFRIIFLQAIIIELCLLVLMLKTGFGKFIEEHIPFYIGIGMLIKDLRTVFFAAHTYQVRVC